MSITVGAGWTIGPGWTLWNDSSALGPTTSTTTPTLASGVTAGTSPNGSPFATSVNSYYWTAGASVPPYYYLSVPGSSAFAFSTGDFTVEWFQYQTDTNSFPRYFWYGSSPSIGMSMEGASYTAYIWGSSPTSIGTQTTNRNAWIHYAVVRISGSVKLYRNGAQAGSTTSWANNITDTTSTMYFGSKAGSGLASEQFGGSMTSIRVCKGIGVYTGAFTVPTSPLAQYASANPYGGSNTAAISAGQCSLLLNP